MPAKDVNQAVEPPSVEAERNSLPNEPVPPQEPEKKKPKYEEPSTKRQSPPSPKREQAASTENKSSIGRVHPVTTSLYMSNLVRPFTLSQLKELLQEHGELEFFWIDKVKSHAYATVRPPFFPAGLFIHVV
jgi:hypothetical protein